MKKTVSIMIVIVLLILTGCSKSGKQAADSKKQSLQPRQVIENYFKYYNEKNREGILSTQTEVNNTPKIWTVEHQWCKRRKCTNL